MLVYLIQLDVNQVLESWITSKGTKIVYRLLQSSAVCFVTVYQLQLDNVCLCSISGPSAKASEEDQERTRRLADAEMHRHHLESLLDQRDREITALREVLLFHVVFML